MDPQVLLVSESDLSLLALKDRYATNRDDLVEQFYKPCMDLSETYDRAVGYFRSSAFLLAMQPIADFALRDGKIRIVCSPELDKDDIEAIRDGYQYRERVDESFVRTIEQAIEAEHARRAFEFIATLVSVEAVDIKIAFRPRKIGIFHDKLGIFSDSKGNSVSFTGSINETGMGWNPIGNHESFDVFRSWTMESGRVELHRKYFERLWLDNEPGVETVPFPAVALERLIEISNPEGINAAYERLKQSSPRERKAPMPHQIEAIETWKRNGKRGILQHATGSGKTFTAIMAIREHVADDGPALIVVPSEILLNQWNDEIGLELDPNNTKVLLAGAGNNKWKKIDVLEGFTQDFPEPRITLATMQTASTPEFLDRIRSGKHLMLVADEVHRIGSPVHSRILSIDAGPRLGLSATPVRYRDLEGTESILSYFEGILDPPFTLADAIEAGRLSRYVYHIHRIYLSDDETENWTNLSLKIKQRYARLAQEEGGQPFANEQLKILLIQRARIVKQASGKVDGASNVIRDYFEVGDRWLVYCDSQRQLSAVRTRLDDDGVVSDEYHSSMAGDRYATLRYFEDVGGVLVAIRCLDEGVDIPEVDHAMILASSRNPREFIQRRGRVLRSFPGKDIAEIHDLVVLPQAGTQVDETSLVAAELSRCIQFAEDAENDAVVFDLRKIALEYGIDPDDLLNRDGAFDEEDQL